MTSTTPPGASATTYGLDATGRIASRTQPGAATETYSFIGTSETVWRIDDGTTVTEAAIDATGSRIATKTGSDLGYAIFDLHGSIAAVSAAGTDIDTALRYNAWGEITATASGSIPTPWRYQGLLDVSPDADNPLYDMGARFYSPGLGAFSQFDTYAGQAQNPLSMNRFLYAHANPATLVDPTGHGVDTGMGNDLYRPYLYDRWGDDNVNIAQTQDQKRRDRQRTVATDRARNVVWKIELQARQEAYDNDRIAGIAGGLWNVTVGGVINLVGQGVSNAGFIANHLDLVPAALLRPATKAFETGADIATHLDQVPNRFARLAHGVSTNFFRGIDAFQRMTPREQAQFSTEVAVTGATLGAGAVGAVRAVTAARSTAGGVAAGEAASGVGSSSRGVGAGSGPWVDDALTTPVQGATRAQSVPGSCVSACGEILTGGARTEAQLLDALGEWSNPQALARELGSGWSGGGFGSSADALAAASRGPMGAVLQAPGGPGHMVVTSPIGGGRFSVLDPFDGTSYLVNSSWIERYVAGGVFR